MASGNGIQQIPEEVTGTVFTQTMWDLLKDAINNGIVTQLGCDLYQSAGQSIGSGAGHAVTFDSENVDTDSMHDPAVNPTRITANTAGFYLVSASIHLPTSPSDELVVNLAVNGVPTGWNADRQSSGGGSSDYLSVSAPIYLNVADYVEVVATQNSGAAMQTQSGASGCRFAAVRL